MDQTNATALFREKVEAATTGLKDLQALRDSDEFVEYVFKVGRYLFEKPLDQLGEDWLTHTGVKLTGAYAYLSNKAAYARAERDVYAQKLTEVESKLMTDYLDSDYKVTETRAIIKRETAEIADLVNQKEYEKNAYENVMTACDRMSSFIQSALRIKTNELRGVTTKYGN